MSMIRHALDYAARGWRVFPVHEVARHAEGWRCSCRRGTDCDRPGKHPRTEAGLTEATTDEPTIRSWWARWPAASIGIATGRESGITVIDADAAGGKPGLVNLTRLCVERGGVPQTLTSETGGGGLHLIFSFIEALRTGVNVLDEAIDVRNDRGYIVAPPSTHVSGQTYKWRDESAAILALPGWMIAAPQEARQRSARRRGRPSVQRKAFTLEQAKAALVHVDADDRDRWRAVGIILGRTYARAEAAWTLYCEWAERSSKFADDPTGNMARMREAFYTLSAQPARGEDLSMGSLISWAREGGWSWTPNLAELENFYCIHPASKVLYVPSGQLWTPQAVDAALPPVPVALDEETGEQVYQSPSKWLAQNRGIESQCSDPALPQVVPNMVARGIGIVAHEGATMFNRYRPAHPKPGSAAQAEPFVNHVRALFPNEAEAAHLLAWLAHRVQRPGEKVRHALLIGGPQGIGKDTIFDAAVPAIGDWNCASIAPDAIFSPFNEYKAAVLVRINEVADLHDVTRYKFYEATKNLISGSPDGAEVNPKYGHKYYVRNCAGVVLTTNYIDTGLYLPADDRRHYAVETVGSLAGDRDAYFERLWRWLQVEGGFWHVAAFLREFDLSRFDPNAPPPKTATFKRIVAHSATSDAWLTDALEQLGDPEIVRTDEVRELCIRAGLKQEEFARRAAQAMKRAGYELLPNPARADLRHQLPGNGDEKIRVTAYVKHGTPPADHDGLLATINRKPRF